MTLEASLSTYLNLLRVQGASPRTMGNREFRLNKLFDFLKPMGITTLEDVTLKELNEYQANIYYQQTSRGTPLSIESQISYLSAISSFYKTMSRAKLLINNPALELELPRHKKTIPAHFYSNRDLQKIYSGIEVDSVYGYQFRVMVEVFASCGLRSGELCRLELQDLELDDGFILIREGKGRRDRRIPIGKTAIAYLREFVESVRPHLVKAGTRNQVFITKNGGMYDRFGIAKKFQELKFKIRFKKPLTPKIFRVTVATSMLNANCSPREVMDMLGHKEMTSLQHYLAVARKDLKKTHQRALEKRLPKVETYFVEGL